MTIGIWSIRPKIISKLDNLWVYIWKHLSMRLLCMCFTASIPCSPSNRMLENVNMVIQGQRNISAIYGFVLKWGLCPRLSVLTPPTPSMRKPYIILEGWRISVWCLIELRYEKAGLPKVNLFLTQTQYNTHLKDVTKIREIFSKNPKYF